jgi:type I site-specific restriction endonuclease
MADAQERIDTRLEALGWALAPFDPAQPLSAFPQHAVTEYETAHGPTDYALCLDGNLLTATPAAHTKAHFKDVVYRYEYERAVREGHLVDYDAVKIKSEVRMAGVFLQEGEEVGLIDTETGREGMDMLEDERRFDSTPLGSLEPSGLPIWQPSQAIS